MLEVDLRRPIASVRQVATSDSAIVSHVTNILLPSLVAAARDTGEPRLRQGHDGEGLVHQAKEGVP